MNKTYTERCFLEIERDIETYQIRAEIWRDGANRIHRGFGLPAITKFAEGSDMPTHVEYRFRGLIDRRDGPAVQVFDPETRMLVREEWFRNGERHRRDGPALTIYDRVTGEELYSENHLSNNPLYKKPDGPSLG